MIIMIQFIMISYYPFMLTLPEFQVVSSLYPIKFINNHQLSYGILLSNMDFLCIHKIKNLIQHELLEYANDQLLFFIHLYPKKYQDH